MCPTDMISRPILRWKQKGIILDCTYEPGLYRILCAGRELLPPPAIGVQPSRGYTPIVWTIFENVPVEPCILVILIHIESNVTVQSLNV